MSYCSEDDPTTPSLISDKRLSCQENLCDCIVVQLEKLFRWRWDWQREYGQYVSVDKYEWQSNTPSPTDSEFSDSPKELGRLRFDRSAHANDIMLYNSALMWLMTLLWKVGPLQAKSIIQGCARHAATSSALSPKSPALSHNTSFEPLNQPGAAFSIRDPAIEICRVLIGNAGTMSSVALSTTKLAYIYFRWEWPEAFWMPSRATRNGSMTCWIQAPLPQAMADMAGA